MADLTPKQLAWANAYLETFNKTEAARRAGYEGNDVTLASIGYENFRKPQIEEYIKQRLNENAMPVDEVLSRLADIARGSLADFSDVQLLSDLKDHPKAHLVKTLTTDVYEDAKGKVHYKTRIELYPADANLERIGKAHGLFNERIEHTGKDGGPIQFSEVIVNVKHDEPVED